MSTYGAGTYGAGTYGGAGDVAAAPARHGGNLTGFDGETLKVRQHVARLLEEERQRADDEALVLLLCG